MKLAVVAPLALLLGLVVAVVAPGDWVAGDGTATLRYEDVEISEPVMVGDERPVRVARTSGDLEVELALPNGIPLEAPIERTSTQMYTPGQILRHGAILDVVGIVLLALVVTRVWEFLGLV